MNYLLRNILAILLLLIIQYYFLRKAEKAAGFKFPKFKELNKKLVRPLFFVLINIYPIIIIALWFYKNIWGIKNYSYPESDFLDNYIIIPFWVLQLIIFQTVIFFAALDVFKLLLYPFLKKIKEKVYRIESRIIFLIIAGFLIYVPARVYYDWNKVSIRIVELEKKNLSKDLEDFNLVFISDVQADRYTVGKRLDRYINKVNSLQPDLVLIGGDVITGSPDYIKTAAEYLGKINSVYGVYSCVGDHDNWAYREDNFRSRKEIMQALEEKNVQMLDNKKLNYLVENAAISVSFITHTYVQKISKEILDSVSTPDKKSDLNIFLTHQPQEFLAEAASKKGFDLMLAGHTHGGQITFLFPFYNISPSKFETKYVKGNFRIGNMLLIVNRGLGMSLVPARYNSTPEITLVKFKSKN